MLFGCCACFPKISVILLLSLEREFCVWQQTAGEYVIAHMKEELHIGKTYRLTLRDRGVSSLEGLVKSVELPSGFAGNHDGRHPIWLAGALVDWYLGPDEIEQAEEIAPIDLHLKNSEAPGPGLRLCTTRGWVRGLRPRRRRARLNSTMG